MIHRWCRWNINVCNILHLDWIQLSNRMLIRDYFEMFLVIKLVKIWGKPKTWILFRIRDFLGIWLVHFGYMINRKGWLGSLLDIQEVTQEMRCCEPRFQIFGRWVMTDLILLMPIKGDYAYPRDANGLNMYIEGQQ